jgi:hypothetical protein
MPVSPAIWEVEVGESWVEASMGKVSVRAYLRNTLKAEGLGLQFK